MGVPLVRSNIANLVDHMCVANNSNHDNDKDNAVQGEDKDENIDEEDDSVPLWLQKLSVSSPLLRL